MKVIYYNHHSPDKYQVGFRCSAEAWWVENIVNLQLSQGIKEYEISESLYWGLIELNVVDKFQLLPKDGVIDTYEEGILFNEGLSEASKILRETASLVSDDGYDLQCAKQLKPERIEYRIKIQGNQLRNELIELADFFTDAKQAGYAIQLWL